MLSAASDRVRVPAGSPAAAGSGFNGGDAAAADAEMKAQELRELTALGFPEQQARVRMVSSVAPG